MRHQLLIALTATTMAWSGVTQAQIQATTWSTTGDMPEGRQLGAITMLPNGEVLMVGGQTYTSNPLHTVMLNTLAKDFDWYFSGRMSTPRVYPQAAPLKDGTVLVTGGHDGNTVFDSAESFDPSSVTWSPAASMRQPRSGHTSTPLNDGTVLVSGGTTDQVGKLATAEIYDPTMKQWSYTTSMAQARLHATATLLSNGKVLVVGGNIENANAQAEIYDPVTKSWSMTGAMVEPHRLWHTATRLTNGRVLIAGGSSRNVARLATAEVFDPLQNTWSSAGILREGRASHIASSLPNGKALVTAGVNSDYLYSTSTEIYDSASNSWSIGQPIPESRWCAEAIVLRNGQVLVAGGTNDVGELSLKSFLYTPDWAYLQESLVSYYPFSENPNDRGSLGLNGVNHGATLTSDRNGNARSAYYFGGSAYIEIPGGQSLNGTRSFTLSAWIKPDVATQGVILSKVNPNRDFVFELGAEGGGVVKTHFADSTGYSFCYATSPKVVGKAWTHLASVWTGTKWQIYVNGVLSSERVFTDGRAPRWTGTKFQIGALDTSMARFKGSIDEVRIYNKALSETEINWIKEQ